MRFLACLCLIHLLKLPVRALLLVNGPRFSCGNVPNKRATSRMLTTFPVPLLFLLQEGESVSSASAFYSREILDILAKCIEKWKQVSHCAMAKHFFIKYKSFQNVLTAPFAISRPGLY